MNRASQIRIRSMRVRLPGTSKEMGSEFAQHLCEQLGHLPSEGAAAHIGALRLRVPGNAAADPRATSEAIATTISSKLTRSQSQPHA